MEKKSLTPGGNRTAIPRLSAPSLVTTLVKLYKCLFITHLTRQTLLGFSLSFLNKFLVTLARGYFRLARYTTQVSMSKVFLLATQISNFCSQVYSLAYDQNRKIRTRKQRTDVGKYSFVNRTIKRWNQLPAGLLASLPCKLNTFRKRIKKAVTMKGLQVSNERK